LNLASTEMITLTLTSSWPHWVSASSSSTSFTTCWTAAPEVSKSPTWTWYYIRN
jgi:hypothetical protein